jgi:hypothetical protein
MGDMTAPRLTGVGDEKFFIATAAVMGVVVVTGFLNLWLQGVTSFAAPWPVHLHAVMFMGWVGFFLIQVWLATRGPLTLHRKLGYVAVVYAPLIVVAGTATIVRVLRLGTVPPMWTPAYFFVMNMTALVGFAVLTVAALRLRRRTDWHRRLMICGMAALLITPVNRLMPVPVLFAVMSAASALVILLFPIAGMIADHRRSGRAHPAWLWGFGVLILTGAANEILGRSEVAAAATEAVTAGSAGAQRPPLDKPAVR